MPLVALDVDQVFQRALALHQRGELDQARSLYEEVLRLQPTHADALQFLGAIELHFNRPERAIDFISRSIAINRQNPGCYLNLGNAQKELLRYDAAIKSYDEAIALKPDYALAFSNKGVALQMAGCTEVAISCFERSITLNPSGFEAFYNLGNLYKDTGRFAAAIASYGEAIVRNKACIDAYLNRSAVFLELKQLDAAIESFDQAIAVDPQCAKAHWNKALVLLLAGHLVNGWEAYEWRWRIGNYGGRKLRFNQPVWQDTIPVKGKTVLIHAEQGLGDTIQFCRYAKLLASRGALVVLEVQPPLVDLLQPLTGISKVLAAGSPLPAFDFQCPLLSMPRAFNTMLETIPSETAYLHADLEKVRTWAAKLGERKTPRIGLVWSGNKDLIDDHTRSIALSALLSHLPSEFDYVSLQKELRESDAAVLSAGGTVRHFGADLIDFTDTAALCELMDVVISVDTSVAHLSGALGKKTWVLLSHIPDWRWLLDRSDSPWYPSVSLYRQTVPAQWGPLLEQVGADLLNMRSLATSFS